MVTGTPHIKGSLTCCLTGKSVRFFNKVTVGSVGTSSKRWGIQGHREAMELAVEGIAGGLGGFFPQEVNGEDRWMMNV